jgi:hypothetical protein
VSATELATDAFLIDVPGVGDRYLLAGGLQRAHPARELQLFDVDVDAAHGRGVPVLRRQR